MSGAKRAGEGTASLEKAIDVLEAVGDSPDGIGHLELAERIGLPKTTVYRILATLVARGLVWRDPIRHAYCLGSRTIELARKAYAMPDLVAAARFELRTLRDLTGETTYLAALDGADAISLERCEGAHNVRSASVLGVRKPLYCTSQGKAMLSRLPDAERDALVAAMTLRPLTPKTLTDRRSLRKELKATAERGYAIDEEEIVMGVRCVGAPIVDPRGRVRGAISIAGPAYRMTRERVEQLGPEVAEAGRRIGQQLGVTEVRTIAEASTVLEAPASHDGAMPRWSAKRKALYWADTHARAVLRHSGKAGRSLATAPSAITGLALHRDGLLVAHEKGWHVLDDEGHVHPRSGWPGKELRALAVHPNGTLWGALPGGDGRTRFGTFGPAGDFLDKWEVDEDVGALAWNASGDMLYATAARSSSILALRSGTRAVQRLATMPRGAGIPGGLAVDAEGGVWTALAEGWSVVRFAPDGALDRVVALPVPRPTDVAFGGAGSKSLYVTSARTGLSKEILASAPLSGRVFEIDAGIAGFADATTT